jgi:hypothetical protein
LLEPLLSSLAYGLGLGIFLASAHLVFFTVCLSEVSTRNKKIVLIYDRNDFDNQLHFETTLANPFGFLKDSANATKTKYSPTFLPIALSNE